MQVVALSGSPDVHAADRVGRVRSTGVRVYAPAHLPREAVLRWAARHAQQTGADLQVLVEDEPRPDRLVEAPPGLLAGTVRALGGRLLDLLPRPWPSEPVARLAGAAAGARLLVLPAAMPDLELVVTAAPEPAVVVPDRPLPRGHAPVVLGLGPRTGPAAVSFAFDVAAATGAPLHVVRAGDDEARQDCRDGLSAWRLARPEVTVDVDVVDADPVWTLRERSRSAGLVVVGRASHGAWRGLRASSLVAALLRAPAGPVAVVPDRSW